MFQTLVTVSMFQTCHVTECIWQICPFDSKFITRDLRTLWWLVLVLSIYLTHTYLQKSIFYHIIPAQKPIISYIQLIYPTHTDVSYVFLPLFDSRKINQSHYSYIGNSRLLSVSRTFLNRNTHLCEYFYSIIETELVAHEYLKSRMYVPTTCLILNIQEYIIIHPYLSNF